MKNKKHEHSLLIIDDEEFNIAILSDILRDDYDINVLKNGKDAVRVAIQHMPSLILLDIIMEGIDGFEVLGQLRENNDTKDIPVIFISQLTNPGDEAKGLALGAADYIIKPFSPIVVKLRVQNKIKMMRQMRMIMDKELSERSVRIKSDFLSRMNHEMRTPMNTIIGMVNIAKRTGDYTKKADCIDKIDSESRYLLRLIDDMLDIDAIERGALYLNSNAFFTEALIRSIVDSAQTSFDDKGQNFNYSCDAAVPNKLVGDEKRLSQILSHLLSNANKFTPRQGSIQLKINSLGENNGMHTLLFEVQDNGIGMSDELKGHIFTPFDQSRDEVFRMYGGAGLGLALSKHLIEMMNGKIMVESQIGKGTVMSFTVRLGMSHDAIASKDEIQSDEIKTDAKANFEGKKALMVEDEEMSRTLIQAALRGTGLAIDIAQDGKQGLEMFGSTPDEYDIILMDMVMPVMDGWEATRRIRAMRIPQAASIPILAVTARSYPEDIKNCFESGMNDCIAKPLDVGKLISKIGKLLAQ